MAAQDMTYNAGCNFGASESQKYATDESADETESEGRQGGWCMW